MYLYLSIFINTYRYIYIPMYTYIHMIYEPDIEVPLLLAVSSNDLSKRNVCVWTCIRCGVGTVGWSYVFVMYVYIYIYVCWSSNDLIMCNMCVFTLSRVQVWQRFNLCYRGNVVRSFNHQMIWVYVIRVCARAHAQVWKKCDLCYRGNGCRL